jgi:hypothetical protein
VKGQEAFLQKLGKRGECPFSPLLFNTAAEKKEIKV